MNLGTQSFDAFLIIRNSSINLITNIGDTSLDARHQQKQNHYHWIPSRVIHFILFSERKDICIQFTEDNSNDPGQMKCGKMSYTKWWFVKEYEEKPTECQNITLHGSSWIRNHPHHSHLLLTMFNFSTFFPTIHLQNASNETHKSADFLFNNYLGSMPSKKTFFALFCWFYGECAEE